MEVLINEVLTLLKDNQLDVLAFFFLFGQLVGLSYFAKKNDLFQTMLT